MNQKKIKTREVLAMIAVGTIVITAPMFTGLPAALISAHKAWKNISKKDLGRIIKRLEKQRMISIKDHGNKTKIEITDKGKKRLLEYSFEDITLKTQTRDNKWRVVAFDIPEKQKKNRELFRKKLIQLGFMRMQDSVFIGAFPCKNEIDFLCHYLNISKSVSLLKLEKIERGETVEFRSFSDLS
jgi:DNA-binding transcriptional regulator PaaX